jgi:hypothetical protein
LEKSQSILPAEFVLFEKIRPRGVMNVWKGPDKSFIIDRCGNFLGAALLIAWRFSHHKMKSRYAFISGSLPNATYPV